jgi:hypothetical protein
VYEFSTESLFFGRQDAMQRTVLLAMHEWLAETGRCGCTLVAAADAPCCTFPSA